jgi:hypothetical protein
MLESGSSIGAGHGRDERKHVPDQVLARSQVTGLRAPHDILELTAARTRLRGFVGCAKHLGEVAAAAKRRACERFPRSGEVFVHRRDPATES